jgi:hypothetical protein
MIQFFMPQWSVFEAAGNAGLLNEIRCYVGGLRKYGLSDGEIAVDVDQQWPGVIPGGARVTTCSDGSTWVTNREFERGDA